jgi:hypothetical protein
MQKQIRAGAKRHQQKKKTRNPSMGLVACACLVILLTASALVQAGAIKVKWDANTEPDLAGYKVYLGTSSKSYSKIVDVGDTTSTIVRNVNYGQRYYVVVTAYDEAGNESNPSSEVTVLVTPPQIAAEWTSTGMRLKWGGVYGADSYEVFRDAYPYADPSSPIALVPDTTYLDTAFPRAANQGAYYTVIAMEKGAESFTFPRVGGYSVSLSKGANLVSLPLVPSNQSINSVVGSQLLGGRSKSTSDYVMVFKDNNSTESAWQVEGTTTSWEGKWVTDDGGRLSPIQLTPDAAFWVYRRETHKDSLVTIAGKVSSDSNRVITLKQGFNFIGSCYPTAVSLTNSGLGRTGLLKGANSSSGSDKIINYKSIGYEFAWLVAGTGTKWDGQFMNEAGTGLSTISLRPGRGYIIWIKNTTPGGPWTYPNPVLTN